MAEADVTLLAPADELAEKAHHPHPGESSDYAEARKKLLAEEVELRRHLERVAAQRRAQLGDAGRDEMFLQRRQVAPFLEKHQT